MSKLIVSLVHINIIFQKIPKKTSNSFASIITSFFITTVCNHYYYTTAIYLHKCASYSLTHITTQCSYLRIHLIRKSFELMKIPLALLWENGKSFCFSSSSCSCFSIIIVHRLLPSPFTCCFSFKLPFFFSRNFHFHLEK